MIVIIQHIPNRFNWLFNQVIFHVGGNTCNYFMCLFFKIQSQNVIVIKITKGTILEGKEFHCWLADGKN